MKKVLTIGGAFGMERLMLLVEPLRDQLNIPMPPALNIVIPMTETQHTLALLLADELRAHDICTDVLFEGSMKSMMKKANKLGAAYVLIIGETEQENRTVMLKNMVTGNEEQVLQIDLVERLRK